MKKLAFICTVCATLNSGILFASALEPKESVAEYPFACTVEHGSLGVEYLRRSLPTPRGMQHIRGVLIFEVGVFPAPGKSLHLTGNSFELDWKRNKNPPLVPVDYQLLSICGCHTPQSLVERRPGLGNDRGKGRSANRKRPAREGRRATRATGRSGAAGPNGYST